MKRSVVWQLIRKDWRLHRQQLAFTMVAGAIGLAILQWRGETLIVLGAVMFFIGLIVAGAMLPIGGIVNERKKQNLAFLMSLPISSIEYTTSKLISSVTMYLIPWFALVISALLLIETRGILPRGAIPVVLILSFLPLLGFCLITAAALVGEAEGWALAANVLCNSVYGLIWYFMTKVPALMENLKSPTVVWNSTSLTILACQLVAALLILGLTYFFQSRKRDFV